jgi:UTP--glucose-1-phosphate uridylyltransferase
VIVRKPLQEGLPDTRTNGTKAGFSVTSKNRIRKAVIPAAGLGTRFLPASKVVPKELLPLASRPLIQFAVEEAVASGLDTLILVLSRAKSLVAEYFRHDVTLEQTLMRLGHDHGAALVRHLSELADIRVVWQETPLGLADAIRTARPLLADEPFAVILPDAIIDSTVPCIRQLMQCYENYPGCIVATQMVEPSETDRFGILEVTSFADFSCGGRALRVTNLTERPHEKSTCSRYGIFGRYILEQEIFDSIEQTRPGFANELQLTDALLVCARRVPLYAYHFEGVHYDAGSKLGYLQASVSFALKDPELAGPLREYLSWLAPSAVESTR